MEERSITEHRRAKERQRAPARRAALRADVRIALAEEGSLNGILQRCAEAMVCHLDAAFARIWTLNKDENMLILQASAGLYTHVDGSHSRVPVGKLKIGLIAQEKKPHLTNDIINDKRVSDRAWAASERMVAFAGYPLIVEGRVIGVMAMFSRKALTSAVLDELASVADTIAQGIERKRGEEAQRKQLAAMETSIDGIAIVNPSQCYTYMNEAHAKIYGYDRPEELIGKTWRVLYYENEIKRCEQEAMPKLWETGHWRGELIGKRRDGRTVDTEVSLTILQGGDMICVCRDITERKEIEEALQKSESRNRSLLEINNAIITNLTQEALFRSAYEAIRRVIPFDRAGFLLYRPEKATLQLLSMDSEVKSDFFRVGKEYDLNVASISAWVLEHQRAVVRGDLEQEQQSAGDSYLVGEGIQSYCVVPIVAMGNSIGTFTLWSETKNRYSEADVELLQEVVNQVALAIANMKSYEEIAALKVKLEKHAAELEQRVAERTAELEAFSYSVSHDLRTPLLTIDGFSQMLLEDYSDKLETEGRRLLSVICSNSKNMGQLIDDLLTFSRLGRQEMRYSEINMCEMAGTVFKELTAMAPERNLQFDLKPLLPAHGDGAMLRQVFVNLFSNALKFTIPKERAVIEAGATVGDGQNIYYVKDNGVGFDMNYADKLFGVFQRLHPVEEFAGTGVGLALVQRIIHRHGGRVWAEGKVGEGATVYFSLPRKEEK